MGAAHYPQGRSGAPVGRRPGPSPAAPAAAVLGLLCCALSACYSAPSRPTAGVTVPHEGYESATELSHRANDVLLRALGLVGTPYRYGGNTPAGGFDCSGLVGFVFREAAGLQLPRTTSGLMDLRAPSVSRGRLRPGDLVLFRLDGGGHVGIYVGEGRFVHAPSAGGTVRMDRLDQPYWSNAWAGGRRVL
jgi:cell wall-associated NlpC family hydrolase